MQRKDKLLSKLSIPLFQIIIYSDHGSLNVWWNSNKVRDYESQAIQKR